MKRRVYMVLVRYAGNPENIPFHFCCDNLTEAIFHADVLRLNQKDHGWEWVSNPPVFVGWEEEELV